MIMKAIVSLSGLTPLISMFMALFFFGAISMANTPEQPIDVNYNKGIDHTINVEEFGDFSPTYTVGELAQNVLIFFMSLLGGVGLLGVIAGGVMVMSGGVSESTKERGKELLMYSVIGVSVAVLSLVIVTLAQTFIYSLGT